MSVKSEALARGIKKIIADGMTSKFSRKLKDVYDDKEETKWLCNEVTWYGASKMIYVAVLDTIHDLYGGLMDYGYIRLVAQWLQKRKINEVNETIILAAQKDILPSENYAQLLDKIKVLVHVNEEEA